jgi:hypothetical protein
VGGQSDPVLFGNQGPAQSRPDVRRREAIPRRQRALWTAEARFWEAESEKSQIMHWPIGAIPYLSRQLSIMP